MSEKFIPCSPAQVSFFFVKKEIKPQKEESQRGEADVNDLQKYKVGEIVRRGGEYYIVVFIYPGEKYLVNIDVYFGWENKNER